MNRSFGIIFYYWLSNGLRSCGLFDKDRGNRGRGAITRLDNQSERGTKYATCMRVCMCACVRERGISMKWNYLLDICTYQECKNVRFFAFLQFFSFDFCFRDFSSIFDSTLSFHGLGGGVLHCGIEDVEEEQTSDQRLIGEKRRGGCGDASAALLLLSACGQSGAMMTHMCVPGKRHLLATCVLKKQIIQSLNIQEKRR